MEHPVPPDPNAALEVELARRLAVHCVHDAGRILTDVMYQVPKDDRKTYTKIVGALNTLERQLRDLEVTP